MLLEMLDSVGSDINDTFAIFDAFLNISEAFGISGTFEETLNNLNVLLSRVMIVLLSGSGSQ